MKTIDNIAKARRQLELELEALEEIRDLVRVKIHLGGMEIKEALHGLEPQIFAARRRATEELAALGDAVTQDVLEALASVRVAVGELRDRLGRQAAN